MQLIMNLDELRIDSTRHQKKGLHFILASVIIWLLVGIIHSTKMSIEAKNFCRFSATTPLIPIAYAIAKMIKSDFTHKSNPLLLAYCLIQIPLLLPWYLPNGNWN